MFTSVNNIKGKTISFQKGIETSHRTSTKNNGSFFGDQNGCFPAKNPVKA